MGFIRARSLAKQNRSNRAACSMALCGEKAKLLLVLFSVWLGYLVFGMIVFAAVESNEEGEEHLNRRWNYGDSFWFVFVLLTTVGKNWEPDRSSRITQRFFVMRLDVPRCTITRFPGVYAYSSYIIKTKQTVILGNAIFLATLLVSLRHNSSYMKNCLAGYNPKMNII